ncbi:MAG: histidinol-phosphate transaminase [Desulfotalea sp.]
MKLDIPRNIENIKPYPPGKPIDELEREYGISNPIKLASNENSWGPSLKAIEAIENSLSNLMRYPDGSSFYLTEAIAKNIGVDSSEVVLGNGSNEVIEFLVKAFISEGKEVITSHPSFLMYQKFVQVRGGTNKVIKLKNMRHDLETILAEINSKTRLIFIDNPNNPTGTFVPPSELYDFISKIPEHVILVLDEAYIEFMDDDKWMDIYSLIRNTNKRCAVVALRTFSKVYGLSGLRIGYGIMPKAIAECLHKVRQPFNVNSLAQVGALAAIEDKEFTSKTIKKTRDGLIYLTSKMKEMGCIPYPSQTNFVLVDVKGNADQLYEAMLRKGVIIRSMSAYGFSNCIRVTVGNESENTRFLYTLLDCLGELGYVQ